jgi:VWFA-related protein
MRRKKNSQKGTRTCAFLGIGFIWLFLTADSNSGENQIQPRSEAAQTDKNNSDFRTLISTKEIRLDAVVLDKKGRQVTDLIADDFEIYQDNKKQLVTSCTYIYYDQARPVRANTSKDSKTQLPAPNAILTRQDARRTMVFLVDNLSMNSVQIHRAQLLLQRFVETQMQQEDVVAIIQTLQENSELQKFSSDKQFLLSVINKLLWSMDLRTMGNNRQRPVLSLLSYCIKALSDMPGRKSLIAISAEAMLLGSSSGSMGSFAVSPTVIEGSYNSLSDAAFRAGAVIHLLDISGLSGPDALDGAFTAERGSGRISPEEKAKMASKTLARRNAEASAPLAKRTGGLFIRNSNLFKNGIGPIDELLKGYYILTYTPSADTFIIPHEINANNLPYHKINIQVKRPVDEVLTRDGFLGAPQGESPATGK